MKSQQHMIACTSLDIFNMSMTSPPLFGALFAGHRAMIISPARFAGQKRSNAAMTDQRDDLIAAIAKQVFIASAPPRTKMEAFARRLSEAGKPLLTIDRPENENLVELGARPVTPDEVAAGGINLPHRPARGNWRIRQPVGMQSQTSLHLREGINRRIDPQQELDQYEEGRHVPFFLLAVFRWMAKRQAG